MSDDAETDLTLIAHQQKQIISDIASLRDDMRVLTAIAMRQDGTLAALLTEVRAMHAQHSRLAHRVHELEQKL
jgi:uncharacterized coiled-coil DUF342 family protein